MKNGPIARRKLLGAGLAIGGSLASGLASSLAPVGAEMAVARVSAPADLSGKNYWAQKGDVKLAVFRGAEARSGGRQVRARLVHGAWLVAVGSLQLRLGCPRERILNDGCICPRGLRRMDHGP